MAEQDERVRRLRDALRTGSVPAVAAVCQEYEASPPSVDEGGELAAALEDARAFLERQRALREQLVQELFQAVKDRKSVKVRSLLVQAEIAVGHDRSKEEDETIRAAGTFLEEQKRTASWEHRDATPPVRGPKRYRTTTRPSRTSRAAATTSPRPDPAAEAHHRMRDLLSDLRRLADRLPEREVNRMIRQLQKAADEAGGHVTAPQREEVDSWIAATHLHHPAVSGRDPHDRQARSAQRKGWRHRRRASSGPAPR